MDEFEPGSEGVWRMVAAVIDGKDVPVGRSVVMEVKPEGWAVKVNGRPYQGGTTKVHPGTVPLESDALVTQGKDAGKALHQISKIEGNVLIGCSGKAGAARPSEFSSERGGGQVLSVWLRDAKAIELHRRHSGVGRWASLFWLPVLLFADDVDAYKVDLIPKLGYWGSLVTIGLALAAIQVVTCLLLKWGWRASLAIGLSMPVAILVDKELTRVLDLTLGHTGATLVALSTTFVAGYGAWLILDKLLRARD